MRVRLSERYFWIAAAGLFLVRHLFAVRLPIAPRSYTSDDLLMVQMAGGLLKDGGLGVYRYATLMKGMFFPLFLAASRGSGLTYLGALSLINALACLYFVQELKGLLPDWRHRLVLFAVLLFDPCMCAEQSFQRVYRCSVTEMQVLFLFGSYFGRYLRTDGFTETGRSADRSSIPGRELFSSLVGGVALWSLWNNREESVWIVPYVGTATVLTGLRLAAAFRKGRLPGSLLLLRGLLCLLPCLMLFAGNGLVRWRNQQYYGAAVRLEEEDGTFKQALQSIYSVKNRTEIPKVTVSREKLDRLYAVSPSLRSIRKELEEHLAFYNTNDRNPEDGEVEDGWFFWALRKAAHSAGAADTLPKSQAFWLAVHQEIEQALADPDTGLERQPVMPSALMSPWRADYGRELPGSFFRALQYVASYREVGVLTEPTGRSGYTVSLQFERQTGNRALYQEPERADQNREVLERMMPAAVFFNGIAGLYRLLNPLALALAAVLYVCRLAGVARRISGDRRLSGEARPSGDITPRKDGSLLLIAAGMVLSAVPLILGACYSDLTAFSSIRYHYLAGVYPLMIASEWLIILCAAADARASGCLLSRRPR